MGTTDGGTRPSLLTTVNRPNDGLQPNPWYQGWHTLGVVLPLLAELRCQSLLLPSGAEYDAGQRDGYDQRCPGSVHQQCSQRGWRAAEIHRMAHDMAKGPVVMSWIRIVHAVFLR